MCRRFFILGAVAIFAVPSASFSALSTRTIEPTTEFLDWDALYTSDVLEKFALIGHRFDASRRAIVDPQGRILRDSQLRAWLAPFDSHNDPLSSDARAILFASGYGLNPRTGTIAHPKKDGVMSRLDVAALLSERALRSKMGRALVLLTNEKGLQRSPIMESLGSINTPDASPWFWHGSARRGGLAPIVLPKGERHPASSLLGAFNAQKNKPAAPSAEDRIYPGPYWADDYPEDEPGEGTAMFTPSLFNTTPEALQEKVVAHMDATPQFKKLRENYVEWINFRSKDKTGCDMEPRQKKNAIRRAHAWLESVDTLTRNSFTSTQLEKIDPYGYRLLAASSFLGRCDYSGSAEILERIYMQIKSNGMDETPRRALHYPNLVSYYFEVELDSPYLEIYLAGVRTGIMWGHLKKGKDLPAKFERAKEDLQRDLEPGILSYEGFVGKGEDYQKVIAEDRKLLAELECFGKKPCSSRELGAAILDLIRQAHRQASAEDIKDGEAGPLALTWRGKHFEIKLRNSGSDIQLSPFKDGLQGVGDYYITRLSAPGGEKIDSVYIAGLVPYLIYSRGFFEGRGTTYRMDPVKLVNLFVDSKQKREANLETQRRFEEKLKRPRME